MYDVVTFGEAMVRLSSPEYRRLENATKLDVEVGGGEYNVAVGCAHLGLKAAWVSRLVDNWTGWIIRNKGCEHGVDMSHVVWVPFDWVGLERNGFYHMELGVGPRPSAVTYDRGHSAISKVAPGMVDFGRWGPLARPAGVEIGAGDFLYSAEVEHSSCCVTPGEYSGLIICF